MLLSLLLGCAPTLLVPGPLSTLGQDAQTTSWRRAAIEGQSTAGEPIARAAAGWVGASKLVVDGRKYREDCSGFVEASLARAGLHRNGSSADLWKQASDEGLVHHRKRPSPGDVAFFDDTYDRNGNGVRDDALSHTAVVEHVDEDGTITLVHYANNGIVRLRMNLYAPHDATKNDPLRSLSKRDPAGIPRLAGELWVGFASFYRVPPQLADGS